MLFRVLPSDLTTSLRRWTSRLRAEEVLPLSFLTLIAIGTLLLSLPAASVGRPLGFVDALFTATSATTVTGLVVVDTGADLTLFGQLVVLALIQLGGLGIMTFSTFFTLLVAGRLSILGRELLEETLSQSPIHNLGSLVKWVVLLTLAFEAVGSLFLTVGLAPDVGWGQAWYYGIFHAISAFCNAGFSLFSTSFEAYQDNALINGILALLIIAGGLGFIVLFDLREAWRRRRSRHQLRLSLHSKLVLTATGILIVVGAAAFAWLEWDNSLRGQPLGTKVLASVFQSITTRTAGFNTVAVAPLTNPTLLILIFLMFIGASPASCGGGVKTSTFSVLIGLVRSRFLGRQDVVLYGRRLPTNTVAKAISVAAFSILLVSIFVLALSISEMAGLSHEATRGKFLEIVFETVSAFGTVGLSMGTTSDLTTAGRVLVALLMFLGRLGPLTIAVAVGGRRRQPTYRYATETVLIG
jgi:trk system potassium uptake protein TrkH